MSWIEDARDTHIPVTFVGDDYETCLVCSQPAPCIAIRLADELEAANATISRFQELIDRADANPNSLWIFTSALRQALKGQL